MMRSPSLPARPASGANASKKLAPEGLIQDLFLAAGRRDLGCEIGFLLFDSFAESIAHKSGDLHRATDLALSFLHRLGSRFALFVMDKRLPQQADFLVIGLQARLDDLLDHVLRLALLAVL